MARASWGRARSLSSSARVWAAKAICERVSRDPGRAWRTSQEAKASENEGAGPSRLPGGAGEGLRGCGILWRGSDLGFCRLADGGRPRGPSGRASEAVRRVPRRGPRLARTPFMRKHLGFGGRGRPRGVGPWPRAAPCDPSGAVLAGPSFAAGLGRPWQKSGLCDPVWSGRCSGATVCGPCACDDTD